MEQFGKTAVLVIFGFVLAFIVITGARYLKEAVLQTNPPTQVGCPVEGGSATG